MIKERNYSILYIKIKTSSQDKSTIHFLKRFLKTKVDRVSLNSLGRRFHSWDPLNANDLLYHSVFTGNICNFL